MLDTATDVVRVRFPDPAGWSAVRTAHEFGHLVARDTPRFTPFRARRTAEPPLEGLPPAVAASWLEELFADVFATYTAGPVFACEATALHFDPATADLPRGDHPPHAVRVHTLLATLRAMNDRERPTSFHVGPYGAVITMLEGTWTAAVAAAGPGRPPVDPAWTALAGELYTLVDTHYRLGAAYHPTQWASACRLAERVVEEGATAVGNVPPSETDVVDVLTAAWLLRLTTSIPSDKLAAMSRGWTSHLLGRVGDE
jgi:hypothetical protein